ncbi:protein rolling stone-like [Epargyreus clarus]|uniref:protein rolling stone-like n=1 Tax=Epargyreus clarus TaxID=520877 RepID=UPI003C2B6B74
MKQWSQNAQEHCYACCVGSLREGNQTPELFGRSWHARLSPLYWRVPICLWVTIVTTWSVAFFWGPREKFLLYMTHWGLILIFLESLFGIIVTLKNSNGEFSDTTLGLPWYVKTYWVLYNLAVPVAFLVTLFYWCVLKSAVKKVNYSPNPTLDIMLHGVNSVVMLVELTLSAHPSRLRHIMQPLYFALGYCIFTVLYYAAGGVDPWGNHFIYPVIDWSKPEQTLVVITLTALFLALMHLLTVAIAAARDLIVRRYLTEKTGHYNDGFTA